MCHKIFTQPMASADEAFISSGLLRNQHSCLSLSCVCSSCLFLQRFIYQFKAAQEGRSDLVYRMPTRTGRFAAFSGRSTRRIRDVTGLVRTDLLTRDSELSMGGCRSFSLWFSCWTVPACLVHAVMGLGVFTESACCIRAV